MTRYLTVKEACARLGISKRTMLTRLRAGDFPEAFKPGGDSAGWRIPEATFQAFISQRTVAAGGRYRKRPLLVSVSPPVDLKDLDSLAPKWRAVVHRDGCMPEPHVHTPQGPRRLDDGDRIIEGVTGEFYPIGADVFAMTYEQEPEGVAS